MQGQCHLLLLKEFWQAILSKQCVECFSWYSNFFLWSHSLDFCHQGLNRQGVTCTRFSNKSSVDLAAGIWILMDLKYQKVQFELIFLNAQILLSNHLDSSREDFNRLLSTCRKLVNNNIIVQSLFNGILLCRSFPKLLLVVIFPNIQTQSSPKPLTGFPYHSIAVLSTEGCLILICFLSCALEAWLVKVPGSRFTF